jgi:hypothetical protein
MLVVVMSLPLPIRYKPALGLVMVACALFILVVAFITGHLFPQAITGGILFLVSLGYLTQPALVVTSTGVEMKNMLGMTLKTHSFASLADVSLGDAGLVVNGTRVRIARWMLHSDDLKALAAAIAAAGETRTTG